MGLKTPRGKFERFDLLLAAKIWRTPERADPAVAASCRNLSARGCRLVVEDFKLAPGFDVNAPIAFSFRLEPGSPEILGGGKVAWVKKERGEGQKIRLLLGVEYTGVSFSDRERIKAFITSHL